MAATRKTIREASDADLNQMKNMFGSLTVKPVQQDEQNIQITQTESLNNSEQKQQIETVVKKSVFTEENKPTSDTTVGIRMTTAKKREMKSYFIQHGTTMSQGVIDAFSLLKTLEAEGVVAYKDGLLERV